MTNIQTITPRDIARHYRVVFERVKRTKQPAIVVSRKKPQVAIVSLDDMDYLDELKQKDATRRLFQVAQKIRNLLKDERLPRDLARRHTEYLNV